MLILVIAIVVVVGAVIVFVMSRAREGDAVAVATDSAHAPFDDDGEARMIEREPEITWPALFAPESKDLDDAARLRMINDLALVRAPWCLPILRKACEEEREPALRQAAHDAVAACESAAASAH